MVRVVVLEPLLGLVIPSWSKPIFDSIYTSFRDFDLNVVAFLAAGGANVLLLMLLTAESNAGML